MFRRISDVERERQIQDLLADARLRFDRALRSRNDGKPATFDEIEKCAMGVGLGLARELIQRLVEIEGTEEPDTAPCPTCRAPAPKRGPVEKRELRTEAGDVEFTRRKYYCKACRRVFFPSGSRVGARD